MDFPEEINDDVNNLPKKKLPVAGILSLGALALFLIIGVAVNINSSKQYGASRSRASEITPTTEPTPTTTSIKKGVGGDPTNIANIQTLGIQWSYSWYPNIDAFKQNMYDHVPMITAELIRENYINYANIRTLATNYPGKYWLIFNEPDYSSQDNTTPTAAATYFKNIYVYIHDIDPTAKFIVGGIYGNINWLTEFVNEYKRLYSIPPPVDGWHGHIYFGRTEYNINNWRNRLDSYKRWMDLPANGGRKEFWLTEWGCLNSTDVAKQIMIDQTPYLESLDWVTRYAWFNYFIDPNDQKCPNCTGSLTNTDGTLNDLGNTYASFVSSPISNSPTPTTTQINTTPTSTSTPYPLTPTPSSSPTPTSHPCPNYYVNCVRKSLPCPGNTVHDQYGSCGAEFRCCNPNLIAPTNTPTPISEATPTPTPTSSNPKTSTYALGINCGGNKVDIGNDIVYQADRAYTRGSYGYISRNNETYTSSWTYYLNLVGTEQYLYKSERFNLSGYKFDNIENGDYQVTLKFAEIYNGCFYRGCRKFDVSIQGTKVLTKFDIFLSAGGGNIEIDKTFNTKVTNNTLDIGFTKVTNSPKINAIYILKQ